MVHIGKFGYNEPTWQGIANTIDQVNQDEFSTTWMILLASDVDSFIKYHNAGSTEVTLEDGIMMVVEGVGIDVEPIVTFIEKSHVMGHEVYDLSRLGWSFEFYRDKVLKKKK